LLPLLFDWDPWNVSHLAHHDVQPEDAEETLLDPDRIGTDAYGLNGEKRWAFIGATETGRVLFVVMTRRRSRVRVVTGRNATERETRQYRRRRTGWNRGRIGRRLI
jgi:uncharacterized protein